MSDIIERAARAIAVIDYRKGVRDCERPNEIVFRPVPWEDLPAKAQVESMENARAVLRAIREPSEGMLAAAKPEPDHLYGKDGRDADYEQQMKVACNVERMVVRQVWQDMIDAALAD